MTSCANVELKSELPRPRAILKFKGTHDKNSHYLCIMDASCCAPGVGGFMSYMSYNSDSNDSAKFVAFDFIHSKIPYSPVLQELRRTGNFKRLYQRNLNCASEFYSSSDSNTSLVPLQICVLQGRCLKRINASAAGVAYSGPVYDLPSSKDVTEVKYATK
jgi:hypothetical protein